jgi:hypothetical protein
MDAQLVVKNIVVIGNFLPQKFDKYFFLKNNIFQEEDILEDSIFLTEFCMVQTPKMTIQITSQQLIVVDVDPIAVNDISILIKKVISYSHSSITASGVNFHFYISDNDTSQNLSKKYFYFENNLLNKFFLEEDKIGYGYYISKNFKDTRLKLDIKPASSIDIQKNSNQKIIQFHFNFHKDYEENSVELFFAMVDKYNSYLEESKNIISIYE